MWLQCSPSNVDIKIPIIHSYVLIQFICTAHNKIHFLTLYLLHFPNAMTSVKCSSMRRTSGHCLGTFKARKDVSLVKYFAVIIVPPLSLISLSLSHYSLGFSTDASRNCSDNCSKSEDNSPFLFRLIIFAMYLVTKKPVQLN
jgi:hypothetical protein